MGVRSATDSLPPAPSPGSAFRARRPALLAAGAISLALAGCGSAAPKVAPSPSARPRPTITASPHPLPSPSVGTLSCRLPLYGSGLAANPAGGSPEGGFMQLPQGAVSLAPSTTLVATPGGTWQTEGSPALLGDQDEESWDPALGRWLPASPPELSPSGTQYAYFDQAASSLHLVTMASFSDQALSTGGDYRVLGWLGEEIMLGAVSAPGAETQGLYRLSVTGGGVQMDLPPSASESWSLTGAGAVWGTGVDPQDPSPPANGAGDEVLRYDPGTGTVSAWSYAPGLSVNLLGVTAAGQPVELVEGPQANTLEVATGPPTATRLLAGAGLDSLQPFEVSSAFTDPHGTWLTTDSGLYLLTPNLTLDLEQTGNFANVEVVGPCS